jgi:hypothetical protein
MATTTTSLVKITKQYSITDYDDITNAGFLCNLSQETLDIISKLSEQVGAPTYIKTPIFLKKENRSVNSLGGGVNGGIGGGGGIMSSNFKKTKNKPSEIKDDDWEAIRAFQTTQKHVSEGIQKNVDNIRGYLNKITDTNEESMIKDIKAEISQLIEHDTSHENMMKIGYSIFNIASSNSFYSALYARLFKSLMNDYDIFKKIFEDNFKEFMNLFESIEFVDPKKNYDKFCEYTKTNDKRRAMSLFIVNLMINHIISEDEIIEIIKQIQALISNYVIKPEKSNEVEELTENLSIIVTKSKDYLGKGETKSAWESIIKNVEFVTILKPKMKEYPSITNKTIFKHMDIFEEIS